MGRDFGSLFYSVHKIVHRLVLFMFYCLQHCAREDLNCLLTKKKLKVLGKVHPKMSNLKFKVMTSCLNDRFLTYRQGAFCFTVC